MIHVDSLPAGWLGKNHALWVGSHRATGEYFLFTDADIVMERTVLTRAVVFMQRHDLDHLAAFFQKYSSDDAVIDLEFAKALGRLFATISRRLRSEENTLYKAYDKVHA